MLYQALYLFLPGNTGTTYVTNPTLKFGNVFDIVYWLLYTAILLVGFLMAIWMFWGVFEYIFAGGDKEKLSKARKRITYAIIGFAIVIISYSLSRFISDVLKPQTTSNVQQVSTP